MGIKVNVIGILYNSGYEKENEAIGQSQWSNSQSTQQGTIREPNAEQAPSHYPCQSQGQSQSKHTKGYPWEFVKCEISSIEPVKSVA